MLTIARDVYEKIIAHARADHPDEACGMVVGPEGSDRPERFIPMTNIERSPTWHRFDPDELKRVYGEMWERDEDVVVFYHSHTMTEAHPSRTDISEMSEYLSPYHIVVVSTRDPEEAEFRSFRMVDGEAQEEPVKVE
jgi:proteasome lid subunit RPN8/RPN11